MPSTRLTQLTVDRARKPASGRFEYFDTLLPGFGLRMAASGHHSWVVFYRCGGKQRRYTLGTLAQIPKVDDARTRARDVLHEVSRGRDPAEAKAAAKATKKVQASARDPDTVRKVVALFIERYAKPKNRSWRDSERLLNKHIVSRWGERDIAMITRRDVLDLLDALADSGMTTGARRVFANIRKLFSWAVERDIIPASPVANIRAPGKENERERVLADDELTRLWLASEDLGPIAGGFLKLLALTGQRRDEVATMSWADLDLDRAVWTIPKEQTKGDRAHEVPLSPLAIEILAGMPRLANSPYVFTTRGDRPISGYSKIKARADYLSGVTDWRLHDLRRTCGTGMARLGVATSTISRILNHSEGGVTKIYNRYGYIEEKRHALDLWARHIEGSIRPAPENAAELRSVG
jgi:integrase